MQVIETKFRLTQDRKKRNVQFGLTEKSNGRMNPGLTRSSCSKHGHREILLSRLRAHLPLYGLRIRQVLLMK